MATRTLLTKNKIAMRSIQLQEKTAVAGVVEPDPGFDGLFKVTIAGAGILQISDHTYNAGSKEHIFTLQDKDADLAIELDNGNYGLDHFVIQVKFTNDYKAGDTITIKNSDESSQPNVKITNLTCQNIFEKQAAVTGSFKSGQTDLIEIYRQDGIAVINPRVAIWSS